MDLNELSKEELIEILIEKDKENQELRKRCEELEKRLKKYENPHIPSSKRMIRIIREIKEQKKRGAPKGHRGITRETPIPDEVVELKPEVCPKCGSKKVRIIKERKKVSEDIRIIKVTKEFHFYDCLCENCKKRFTTSSKELQKKGRFGPTILSLWNNLHYQGTIPFKRLAKISSNCFGIKISAGGLHNAIYRSAKIFEPEFEEIKENVINSKYVRSDETTYSFNGNKYWLWNLSTKRETLVLLRNSRGAKVLKELFGEFFDGVLNSDCFGAYSRFKAREYQKCWGHVLRDAEDLAKNSKEGAELYKMLLGMFRYIKKVKEEGKENSKRVKFWIWKSKRKISSWINKNYDSKAVLNLVLRMEKYKNDWFTCLKYPEVEPTNNSSERDIRKNVIARKISGLHRSELGMHSREIMMSNLLTLQRRRENPFKFIQEKIEKFNFGEYG